MIKKIYKLIERKTRAIALSTYLAGRFDENCVYILTSSPRSGSTLLGQILGSIPDSCILFEPLNLKKVPEAEAAGFSWRTFVSPEEQWPEGEAFLKRVFEGKIVNGWTVREMSVREAYKSNKMIIKFVRANGLLPWICKRFDVPAPILLIRHPCAVVASQLNAGWKSYTRPKPPRYLDKYPMFQAVLSKVEGDEERLAAVWALDQLTPLLQQTPHPWTIVTYEEIILRPEATLLMIFDKWDLQIDMDDALSRLKKPSSLVSPSGISGINGWRNNLTDKQISRVLSTVNSFGLTFYTKNDEADYSVLHSEELSQHIKKVGGG
jgi:hypothetical protein